MNRNLHERIKQRLDKFQQDIIDAREELMKCVNEEVDNIIHAIETERNRNDSNLMEHADLLEDGDDIRSDPVGKLSTCEGGTNILKPEGEKVSGDDLSKDKIDKTESNEGSNNTDDESEDDGIEIAPLSLKLPGCKSARMLLLRDIIATPTSIDFQLVHTFKVAEKCAVVALEGRHVWVAYHVGENTSLEEYDFGGKLKYCIDVGDHVRRMTCDGQGTVYMTCREAQCIKSVNATEDSLTTFSNTEGYPNGIFYDMVQNRLLFSQNSSPSYFVYEGDEWVKIQSINLQSKQEETIMTEKEFDLGYVASIALNVNGDICIADYINDKICVGTTDGKLKASCDEFRTKYGGQTLHPYEICCDTSGLIFFACTASKTVYVLSEKGDIIHRLMLDFIPNSISVNDKGLLCIGNMMSNNVSVYRYERRYCNP